MSDPTFLLGAGAAKNAAMAIRNRRGQMQAIENNAVSGAATPPAVSGMPAAAPAMAPPVNHVAKPFSPEERAMQRAKLAGVLAKRAQADRAMGLD